MSEDATVALVRALVENMEGAADDWESLSFVLALNDARLYEVYGYTYNADESISAVVVRARLVRPQLADYFEGYYGEDESRPVRLLVQLVRATGTYEITFEDTDDSRWAVTADNLATIREELRPQLDA